ncbi:MAG: DUF2520 domain-containing protein [Bacteroidota bacterium]|nr:DUF2520 domain-containing protein [Bacteroidota bacterium]
MNNKIYLIGVGKVGSALCFELNDSDCKIEYFSDKNPDRLMIISESIGAVSYSEKIEKKFVEGSNIIFICVQDRFIREVIKQIENFDIDLSNKYFIHTSGSESTDVFPSGKFNKKNIASMHPIQTFGKVSFENNRLLKHIYFGIEGGEDAKKIITEIIKRLDSNYIEIPKGKKYLYHSACVITSNFLVTLLNISSEIIGSIGIDKDKMFEIFKPIIDKTLSNISEHGLVESLTGPFERNDIETISKHLSSISQEIPSLIPFYTLLGMETVKVAFKKESLNLKNVISILDLMNEYIISETEMTNKTIN